MKRLTIVLAFTFAFAAAFTTLDRVYSRKFFDVTGRAQWIWAHHSMSANEPVAFFAARDFVLPEQRFYTHVKIDGDPEYTLYINGREVAGHRLRPEERDLDLYDISDIVKTGRNRMVIAIRSPQGVGGLIAAIDLAPETQNWIVTDGEWKIYRSWRPDILERDIGSDWEAPVIVGEPPIGRWNYLPLEKRVLASPAATAIQPRESFEMIAARPAIHMSAGIVVAVADRERATAFDFGPTQGRIRLVLDKEASRSRAYAVRTANVRNELNIVEWNLRPIVFAPGERSVTTTESSGFRYVMVFGRGVRAEVVR